MSKGVLVIKCNTNLRHDDFERIRQIFVKQREEGIVMLPSYCEAIYIPEDVEIKLEESDE